MKFEILKEKFENNRNFDNANQMENYLRNKFKFYGYHSPERKKLYHQDLLKEKKNKKIDWQLLQEAWNSPYREMQYFVCDYLITMERYLTVEDISQIENFVRSKQWWDTIDSLIKPIGKIGLRDDRVNYIMLQWSKDPDFWVRRFAIEHQILRKDRTNTQLLEEIILNNLNQKEFFINKAIGWALRDYSKTNPNWVREFINKYYDYLSSLSIREGSKYL